MNINYSRTRIYNFYFNLAFVCTTEPQQAVFHEYLYFMIGVCGCKRKEVLMNFGYLGELNELVMIRGHLGFCRTSNKTHRS